MDAPIPAEVGPAWEAFFRDVHPTLKLGQDVYPEVFHHGLLFPLQRMAEMAKMMQRARGLTPRVVMEIGSDKGGSFYHWIQAQPSVRTAIAIELRGVPFIAAFAHAFPAVTVRGFAGSSYTTEMVAHVRNVLAQGMFPAIDCLFLDGDKGAFDRDVAAYLPLMQRPGLIFLHDVNPHGGGADNPMATFKSFSGHRRTELILDTSEYSVIAEREILGLPPETSYEGWYRIWKRTSCGVGVVYV